MQLARDEIAITLGNETVYLRPSLRAALRLERRHGGFGKLFAAVADGHLGVMADVIRESADGPSALPAIIEAAASDGVWAGLDAFTAPLLAHVLALSGLDDDAVPDSSDSVERITFAEHHTRLYKLATGWLGWTPDTAWNATPAEIIEAFNGRLDMLKAIFGSGSTEGGPTEFDDTRDEDGWASLKALALAGGNRAG